MKKILLLILAMAAITPAFASHGHDYKIEVEVSDIQIEENAAKTGSVVNFLVKKNAALDDLCSVVQDYNKWVVLYCRVGYAATPVTCTISKIVNVICVTNHTVRLFIEGDIPSALYNILSSDLTYEIAKVNAGKYNLFLSPSSY